MLRTAFEAPLFAFNITVAVCIAREALAGKRPFRDGFFLIYLCQALVEIVTYLWCILLRRLVNLHVLPQYFGTVLFGTFGCCVYVYLAYLIYVLHTMIALNRFVEMSSILNPEIKRWNTTLARCLPITVALLPVPGMAVYLLSQVRFARNSMYNRTSDSPAWLTVNPLYNRKQAGYFTAAGYSIATCLLSILLSLATCEAYRRMSNKSMLSSVERRLLWFMCYEVIVQMVQVVYSVLQAVVIAGDYVDLTTSIFHFREYVVDLLCLTSPAAIFMTSAELIMMNLSGVLRSSYLVMLGYRHAIAVVSTSSQSRTR